MNKIANSFVLTLFTFFVLAQNPCFAAGNSFATQEPNDRFQIHCPGCPEFAGDDGIEHSRDSVSPNGLIINSLNDRGLRVQYEFTMTSRIGLTRATSLEGNLHTLIHALPSTLATKEKMTFTGGYTVVSFR